MTLTTTEQYILLPIGILAAIVVAKYLLVYAWQLISIVVGSVFSIALTIAVVFSIMYVVGLCVH